MRVHLRIPGRWGWRGVDAAEWESIVLLTRAFFGRLFEGELLSARGGAPPILWLAAFLFVPGFLRSIRLFSTFSILSLEPMEVRFAALWTEKLFYVNWAMATTAFVTVLAWEALLPDRRDALILQTLPLRLRTSGAARAASLLIFFGALLITANGLGTLLLPATAIEARVPTSGVAHMLGHFVGVTSASACVFFGILLLQMILANTVNPRWFRRTATFAQCISVVIVLLLFLVRPPVSVAAWVHGAAGSEWMSWLPPLWFLGLYETFLGSPEPMLHAAALKGALALGVTTLGAALMYAVTYARHIRRMVESPEGGRREAPSRLWGPIVRLIGGWVRGPVERAVFDFVLASLARGPRPRLIVSGYAGVGLAFVLAGALQVWLRGGSVMAWPPTVATLAMPLMLGSFILIGLRVSFATPTDAPANWSFRITESSERRPYAAGVRKAMLIVGGAPVIALLPVYWVSWGAAPALAHTWWCLILSRALIAVLTSNFPRIPYTYSVVPGSGNLKAWGPLYLLAFTFFVFVPCGIERWWLVSPSRLAGFFVAAALLEIVLAIARWRIRNGQAFFVYEEDEPEAMVQLRLGL